MATHTTGNGDCIRPYRNVKTAMFKEGASQSFKVGYPLIKSAVAGEEERVIVLSGDEVTDIVGFAAEDATGTAGSRLSVWLATPDAEFRGLLGSGTAATTLDGANVDVEYGISKDGTYNVWYVDVAETTYKVARVTGLIDGDGDTGGYVRFRVKQYRDAEVTVY